MKHHIIEKVNIGGRNFSVSIELIPENDFEKQAIKNVELAEASDEEKELVDNFLLFNLSLGNYSFVDLTSQHRSIFIVKIFQN